MSKSKLLIVLSAVMLLASLPALAQSDPKIGYAGWATAAQSRNIPAGSVNDPGSHLTYILDTGVNARALLNDVSLESAESTPLVDLAEWLDADGNGVLDPGAIIQNFVAITNTHPTMAVTIHFRIYNDNCEDLLDFLVILTCNDTLVFDPFDFEIPGTNGENSRDRLIGPARPGRVLSPVPTDQYGSGRFILTAAASGASIDADWDAEILFPYELGRALTNECNIKAAGTLDGTLDAILAAGNGTRNVGTQASLSDNNLHVFNAYQISFNYLIGYQTLAVPRGNVFQAGGTNAWARPAIDRNPDIGQNGPSGSDGDGPNTVPTGTILLGGEFGHISYENNANAVPGGIAPNFYFLRNEVHGGDIHAAAGANGVGGFSLYGAQGTGPLLPVDPADIIMNFVSVYDDYNGTNNAGVTGFPDWAANIGPAVTTYVLQIYDNNEDLLVIEEDVPIPVSPPVPGETVDLKMVCACLRAWLTTAIVPQTNVDDLTIQEMADILTDEVLTGRDDFDGLLHPVAPDLSGGWIRFVRDNTHTVTSFASQATVEAVGFSVQGSAHGPGTSTFDVDDEADSHIDYGPSFMTISNSLTKQSGFGALWWNYAVAYNVDVAEQGIPNPASNDTPNQPQ